MERTKETARKKPTEQHKHKNRQGISISPVGLTDARSGTPLSNQAKATSGMPLLAHTHAN
jgi:hypothetical protein